MIPRVRDLIEVPPVQTVIRLEEGTARPEAIMSSFVCTSDVTAHFSVLAGALQRDAGTGFFLEGDFGSGKSHFLAALSAWIDDRSGAGLLSRAVPSLDECKKTGRRFLVVDVSLVRFRASTPIERIITGAMETALARRGVRAVLSPLARFREHLGTILETPLFAQAFRSSCGIEPASVEGWFADHPREAFARSIAFLKEQGIGHPESLVEERHEVFGRALDTARENGFDGIVLVIDELSEFFRSKPDAAALNDDARTLQLLGEIASARPLWIIAAVQESIERTGDIASATFRKIKDRFPVRFHLSTLHIRDLIGKRLVKQREGAGGALLSMYEEYRKHFKRFARCPFDEFMRIYPLHPETLALLEGLGELFSQHRGIVDFVHARVAGDPGRSIAGILDKPANELLAPDAIFEHFAPRLAEISAFHDYPRRIVPHLDEAIGRVIEGEEDRALARRLVRILVLYAIHPTADPPSARMLAELCACMLAPHNPDENVKFITAALLDPLAAESKFLVKRPAPPGDPLDAVYEVTSKEDHAGNLRRRMEKALADIVRGDSRLILEPLSELPSGLSWPGPEAVQGCAEKTVLWRQTTRRVLVSFVHRGEESQCAERIEKRIASGGADFAVALVGGSGEFACRFTAVWRFPASGPDADALAEYFAARTVARELHVSNPSHAPLVPLANDTVRRLDPAVRGALMNLFYSGAFDGGAIKVDPSAIQVRRFERLLEAAADYVLEERFPRFKEIAPRLLQPSPRLYQRLIEEFATLGAISMSEARAKALTEAIETLAAPLGLVEVKSGSYRLAPALGEHPFLSYFFSLLRPAGPTPREELASRLMSGPYGVPRETVEFVLVALTQCGIVSLLRGGRAMQLDFLTLTNAGEAEAIIPGEIIPQADRETLQRECPFLAPSGGFASFGLRQQREAWQALVKLKNGFAAVLDETARHCGATENFAAFASFDFESLQDKARRLAAVFSEVKVSYQAREGLERFLASWRDSRLHADDIDLLKKAHRFFTRFADKFIYIAHYVRHQSVEEACRAEPFIAERRGAVEFMLGDPMNLVVPDEGVQIGATFDLFREAYCKLYIAKHRERAESLQPPKLSRSQERMTALFTSLGRVEQLDRPAGIEALLRAVSGGAKAACSRPVAEELLRSPACGCGFHIGSDSSPAAVHDWSNAIESGFYEYRAILAAPRVLEALTAHAFALRDMDGEGAARIDMLCALLRNDAAAAPQPLLDLLDERTVREIGRALSGSVKVQSRPLGRLISDLAGRRLSARKVREIIDAWTGSDDDDGLLLSIDTPAVGAHAAPRRHSWWPLLHPHLLPGGAPAPEEAKTLEQELDEQFPATELEKRFARLPDDALVRFIGGERLHTRAIQAAWLLFVKQSLQRQAGSFDAAVSSCHCVAEEAAAINGRLRSLRAFLTAKQEPFPGRLRSRVHAAELWADTWATRAIRKSIEAAIADLDAQAADWLATLASPRVIDLKESPVVIIVDALPPDVWLETLPALDALLRGAAHSWARLACPPLTVPSLGALFGMPPGRDPLDEFTAAGAVYHTVKGDEEHPLVDLVPPIKKEIPLVIRLNLLDTAAHQMSLPLAALPHTLRSLLERHLPGIIAACSAQKRPLVLTSDHGLSWTGGRLSHGKGGVFEEAMARVEWRW